MLFFLLKICPYVCFFLLHHIFWQAISISAQAGFDVFPFHYVSIVWIQEDSDHFHSALFMEIICSYLMIEDSSGCPFSCFDFAVPPCPLPTPGEASSPAGAAGPRCPTRPACSVAHELQCPGDTCARSCTSCLALQSQCRKCWAGNHLQSLWESPSCQPAVAFWGQDTCLFCSRPEAPNPCRTVNQLVTW